MRYKLFREKPVEGKFVKDDSALARILWNRRIQDINGTDFSLGNCYDDSMFWISADVDCFFSPFKLKNIKQAAECILKHCDAGNVISLVVDADLDGYASSAIAANWIKHYYPNIQINFFIHNGKSHGLKDVVQDKAFINGLKNNKGLLLIPDAGSSDFEEHKLISSLGVDICIADHHICSEYSTDAIVVNNQMDNYPNKYLCGGGVIWKICQVMDTYKGEDFAWHLLDLCALSNLGDMMDYRSYETRAIVKVGLEPQNRYNKLVKEFINKQEYSMKKMNGVNYLSCAFYYVPYINAITRSGTKNEKKIVLNAFLDYMAEEPIESSKRGEKGKLVPLWQEAITVMERVKRRQSKIQDDAIAAFDLMIKQDNMLDNKILLFLLDENADIPREVFGLIANKLQAKYQRPCVIAAKGIDEDGDEAYMGSMRNYSFSDRQNLKSDIESTGFAKCAGHSNASGCFIKVKYVQDFLNAFNELYKDVDQTPTYLVDYIWDDIYSDDTYNKVLEIGGMDIFGQGMPEAKIVYENIDLSKCNITLMSRNKNPTLKVTLPNGISIIKFKSSEEEFNEFNRDKVLTLVAKCQQNEWNGIVSPQLICEDFVLEDNDSGFSWTDF